MKKAKSEQVWQKFRAACDAFMERYRTRDTQQFADRLARREAVAVDLEALAAGLAERRGGARGPARTRAQHPHAAGSRRGSVPREVLRALATRFDAALGAVLHAAPEAFRHSELDAEANRAQLEQLCERVEQVANRQPAHGRRVVGGAAGRPAPRARWPPTRLAAASTTRRSGRAHEYDVRAAQDAWQRVGYVPDAVAAPLAARFQRAVQRFYGEKKGPGRQRGTADAT